MSCGDSNQALEWDTSSCTTFYQLFYEAKKFNQVLRWNTSQVTNMESTFYYASAFDQPLDTWDTSKVQTFKNLFYVRPHLPQQRPTSHDPAPAPPRRKRAASTKRSHGTHPR